MYILSAHCKRKLKIRKKIAKQTKHRLTVYKSNRHIYAQLYKFDGSEVILSMSSLDKVFKDKIKSEKDFENLCKTREASLVGELLAEKFKERNIERVVFDRSGFKFHGRIKAVADSMLKHGIMC